MGVMLWYELVGVEDVEWVEGCFDLVGYFYYFWVELPSQERCFDDFYIVFVGECFVE